MQDAAIAKCQCKVERVAERRPFPVRNQSVPSPERSQHGVRTFPDRDMSANGAGISHRGHSPTVPSSTACLKNPKSIVVAARSPYFTPMPCREEGVSAAGCRENRAAWSMTAGCLVPGSDVLGVRKPDRGKQSFFAGCFEAENTHAFPTWPCHPPRNLYLIATLTGPKRNFKKDTIKRRRILRRFPGLSCQMALLLKKKIIVQ